MDSKKVSFISIFIILIIGLFIIIFLKLRDVSSLSGRVTLVKKDYFVVSDEKNKYKFSYLDNKDIEVNDEVIIKYRGNLDKNKINKMKSYVLSGNVVSIVDSLENNGIFSAYYEMAKEKLDAMTLEEKVGQVLLARVPDSPELSAIEEYNLGGYVLFEKDFKDKELVTIQKEIKSYQDKAKIPLIIATDEEGGEVVRASKNKKLREKSFKSSQALYKEGGLDLIAEDVKDKSRFLSNLGINVNLAPVIDVVTDEKSYMYKRSLGEGTDITTRYSETVIKSSKEEDVSYVLKHFPGYSNSGDTHNEIQVDTRTIDEIKENDLPPFEAGIKAKAEAVLMSHKVVNSIEKDQFTSMSLNAHELLRENLGFSGVIIADDISMLSTKEGDVIKPYIKGLNAGNDMMIVSDYKGAFNEILAGIDNGDISVDTLDKAVLRVLAWKHYKILFPIK